MSLKKQFLKSRPTCKVTFRLPKEVAGNATEVRLLGDFNNWDQSRAITMKMNKNGCDTTVELPIGNEFQFKYLLDGNIWENDWQADKYVATPFGVDNSVVSTFSD